MILVKYVESIMEEQQEVDFLENIKSKSRVRDFCAGL